IETGPVHLKGTFTRESIFEFYRAVFLPPDHSHDGDQTRLSDAATVRGLSAQPGGVKVRFPPDSADVRARREGRLRGQAVWKRPGDSRAGRFRPGGVCFRIPKLGAWGLGDASVHRWRRSDAT